MKRSKVLSALALGLALAGCAGTPAPGNAVDGVQVQRNAQGEAIRAQFTPLPLDCGNALHCPTLGLTWSKDKPRQALLSMGFTRSGHAPVEMVEFDARPFGPMRVRSLAAEQPDKEQVVFQAPIETFERLAVSRGVLVRVHAGGQVLEESFATGERSSQAANALKRWLQQIYKGTEKEQELGLRGLFADQPYER
ncbi:MAG: hypothetical protein KUL80_01095 [Comamonas sp.]|nr:hypothetical protein [Comamonas sp.]